MRVNAAVVHNLIKAQASASEIRPADRLLPVNDALKTLITDVHVENFNKTSGIFYGTFTENADNTAPTIVTDYLNGPKSGLFDPSIDLTEHLSGKIDQKPSATGGYVLFARYTYDESDYLLVCMMEKVDGVGIDDDNLSVDIIQHLETKKVRHAFLMSVSEYDDESEDYLAFVRRGTKDLAARYFIESMGCTDYSDANKQTKRTFSALDAYLKQVQATSQERQEARDSLVRHFALAYEENRLVTLDEISRVVETACRREDSAFDVFVADSKKYNIDSEFHVGNNYKHYVTYSARGPNYTVHFQEKALNQGLVKYNPEENTLVLYDVPDQLASKIKGYLDASDQSA